MARAKREAQAKHKNGDQPFYCSTCKRHGRDVSFETPEEFAKHFETHFALCAEKCDRSATVNVPIVVPPGESIQFKDGTIFGPKVIYVPYCIECAIERGFAVPEGAEVKIKFRRRCHGESVDAVVQTAFESPRRINKSSGCMRY